MNKNNPSLPSHLQFVFKLFKLLFFSLYDVKKEIWDGENFSCLTAAFLIALGALFWCVPFVLSTLCYTNIYKINT